MCSRNQRLATIDDLFDNLWSQEGDTNYPAHIAFADVLPLTRNFERCAVNSDLDAKLRQMTAAEHERRR